MTQPHEGTGPTKTVIDENEDLFSFDELTEPKATVGDAGAIAPATTGAAPAFSNINEEAMAAVLGPAPTSAPAVAAVPAPDTAPVVGGTSAPAAPAPKAPPVTELGRFKLDFRGSPVLLAALALFALGNLALIGLVWKSMSTFQASLEARPSVATDSHGNSNTGSGAPSGDPHAGASSTADAPRPPAQLEPKPEGEETLANARQAIDRGDFEGARRMLYGLLAVADRWEPARRADLEARATIAIADSYRLQADALAAEPAPPAKTPGEVHAAETHATPEGGHE